MAGKLDIPQFMFFLVLLFYHSHHSIKLGLPVWYLMFVQLHVEELVHQGSLHWFISNQSKQWLQDIAYYFLIASSRFIFLLLLISFFYTLSYASCYLIYNVSFRSSMSYRFLSILIFYLIVFTLFSDIILSMLSYTKRSFEVKLSVKSL